MIRLMNYIYGLGNLYAPSLYEGRIKQPKKIVDLTARGAMAIIGPKIVPPESLKDFLVNNIGEEHE